MKIRANKRKKIGLVIKDGKPVSVILDIKQYEDMLERLEDFEDLKYIEQMKEDAPKFRDLDEFLQKRRDRRREAYR